MHSSGLSPAARSRAEPRRRPRLLKRAHEQRYLLAMSLPFVALVFVFNYVPIWGWLMAFQRYRPGRPFFEQQWVGLKNFTDLFQDETFYLALKNTLGMSVLGLILGFTLPIIFALLLNEMRAGLFKRTVQTVSYLPHFVSWVVVAGLVYKMLSTDGGPINQLIAHFGGPPVQFMAHSNYFWGVVVLSDLWKEIGWNTIIYLAVMTAIEPALYEAARVDGAGRWQLMRHITLPGISRVVIILFVLSIGHLTAIGFEKQLLLSNPVVKDSALVLDLYALQNGIGMNKFSFGTAIGVVNSLVGLALLFGANAFFRRRTGDSII